MWVGGRWGASAKATSGGTPATIWALEQAVCASAPSRQVRPEKRPGESGTLAAGEGGARRQEVPQPPPRRHLRQALP